MIKVVLLLLISGLTACKSLPVLNEENGLSSLSTPVRFLSPNKTILLKEDFPENIVIVLPTIPGSIFGNPSEESIFTGVVPPSYILSIPLKQSEEVILSTSKSLLKEWSDLGLKVEPSETRLSRVGTFPYDLNTKRAIGGGGFINPNSKDSLILVYTDQECEILGDIKLGKTWYRHRIKLPSKGYHFIQIYSQDKNVEFLEYYPKDNKAEFSIYMNNVIDT